MKSRTYLSAIYRLSVIGFRVLLLVAFILTSVIPLQSVKAATSKTVESTSRLIDSSNKPNYLPISASQHQKIDKISEIKGLSVQKTPYAPMVDLPDPQNAGLLQIDSDDLSDIALVCTLITGVACPDVQPAKTITTHLINEMFRRIRVNCTGWGCSLKPIYYSLVCHVSWTDPYPMPKEILTGKVTSYYSTYIDSKSVPCGEGYAGACDIELKGVVPGYDLSSDTRYASITNWFTFNYVSSLWHVSSVCDWSWSLTPIALDQASLSTNDPKGGSGDPRECAINHCADTQGTAGDPINSRTGNLDYSLIDLSLQTPAGLLTFQRSYSSQATDTTLYPTVLGPGWTHNQDLRLLFGAAAGQVIFKGPTSNQYKFVINKTFANGDKSYFTYGGITATLSYTAATQTYTVTDASKNIYVFDSLGLITSWRNKLGFGFDYAYIDGRLDRTTEPQSGRYLAFSYGADGNLASVSDNSGRSIFFNYLNGDLSTFTDAMGQTWTYSYGQTASDLHHLITVQDPYGKIILTTHYDAKGRAFEQFNADNERIIKILFDDVGTRVGSDIIYQNQILDAYDQVSTDTYDGTKTLKDQDNRMGYTTNRAYDGNLRLSQLTDEAGKTTNYSWSPDGSNLTGVTDALGNSTSLGYDALNNIISIIDPLNHQTLFTYDGALLSSSTNALNETTSYTYTPEGLVESITTPSGDVTTYGYDTLGQQTSMNLPDGSAWHYTYDDLGRMTSTTDPFGRVTKTEYDTAGRITKTIVNYDPARLQNEQNIYNITTIYTYDDNGNQTSITDTYGRITQSLYDDSGRLIESIDALGHSTTYDYDLNGNLILQTDPLGHTTTFTYNANNQLLTTTDALGHVTENVYNPDGTLARTFDALDRETNYAYDSLKRVTDTTDAMGNVTHSEYDFNGNLLSTTAPNGAITSYEYDQLGRVIREHNALGGITQSFYDPAGNLIQTIDPRGFSTTYEYDSQGRMVSQTDAHGSITYFTYDALGNRLTNEDPLGRITTYTYNPLGYQTNIKNALNFNSSSAFDALGQLVLSTDPLGRITSYEYDELGRLHTQTDNMGGQILNTYDANGNLLTTTDQNGHTTTMTYNAINQIQTRKDANNLTTTYYYDAVGNLVRQVDAAGNETNTAYDNLNRQIQVTDPSGNITTFGYDSVGNMIRKTDGNNIVTRYEYDLMGNLTAVVENKTDSGIVDNQTNVRTEYQYDQNGNLTTVIDGNGNTATTHTYDELNRRESEMDALGHTTTYTYDAAGNLSQKIDPNGTVIHYTYDEFNRLLSDDYPGTLNDVTFTYDAAGQRTGMTDHLGTTVWTYDDLGRIDSITDANLDTVTYSYDAVGNRTMIGYPDGKTVDYQYDAGNRLSTVTDWLSRVATYSYNTANLVSTITLPNGIISSYTYDGSDRLLSLTHTNNGTVIGSYTYTYDNAGNRLTAAEYLSTGEQLGAFALESVANLPNSTELPADPVDLQSTKEPCDTLECASGFIQDSMVLTAEVNQIITYTYDPLNRLTNAAYSTGDNYAYTYDAVGNRLSETSPAETNSYAYDIANRLTSVNGVSYTWDVNGNILSDGAKTYSYDLANRLTSVADGMHTYQYAYNGLGDRLQSTQDGVTTTYALDLNAGLTQVLEDGVNTYVYGYTRLAQVNDAETGYFLTDALGSVRQVTDEVGAITLLRDYSPYGETTQSLGSYETPYSFTGEMTDASGLVYLRARYYDPATGRFVSRDTWEGDKQNPISLNKWLYTYANPINYVDASGHDAYEGTLVHMMLEDHYLANYSSGRDVIAEYPIIGGSKNLTGNDGRVDIADLTFRQLYEIKPVSSVSLGITELNWYLSKLPGWTPGTVYSEIPVEVGPWPTNPNGVVVAEMQVPGVIVYWQRPRRDPVPVFVPVPVPNPNQSTEQQRVQYGARNGYGELNPQLAFQSCDPANVVVGVVIVGLVVVAILVPESIPALIPVGLQVATSAAY